MVGLATGHAGPSEYASCPWKKSLMTFFHFGHPRKSGGFSGVSAAASSGGSLYPQPASSTFAVYAASATTFSRSVASFRAPRPRRAIFETSILTESRRSVASMSANEGSDFEANHGQSSGRQ